MPAWGEHGQQHRGVAGTLTHRTPASCWPDVPDGVQAETVRRCLARCPLQLGCPSWGHATAPQLATWHPPSDTHPGDAAMGTRWPRRRALARLQPAALPRGGRGGSHSLQPQCVAERRAPTLPRVEGHLAVASSSSSSSPSDWCGGAGARGNRHGGNTTLLPGAAGGSRGFSRHSSEHRPPRRLLGAGAARRLLGKACRLLPPAPPALEPLLPTPPCTARPCVDAHGPPVPSARSPMTPTPLTPLLPPLQSPPLLPRATPSQSSPSPPQGPLAPSRTLRPLRCPPCGSPLRADPPSSSSPPWRSSLRASHRGQASPSKAPHQASTRSNISEGLRGKNIYNKNNKVSLESVSPTSCPRTRCFSRHPGPAVAPR